MLFQPLKEEKAVKEVEEKDEGLGSCRWFTIQREGRRETERVAARSKGNWRDPVMWVRERERK